MEFVTFEIAKKLKEKGFDYPCIAHYDINKELKVVLREPIFWHSDALSYTDAPTISQVLKWLREEKKIYLELVIAADAEYMCDIYKIDSRPIKCLGSTGYSKTYEDAAIVGIEYVLDNLI